MFESGFMEPAIVVVARVVLRKSLDENSNTMHRSINYVDGIPKLVPIDFSNQNFPFKLICAKNWVNRDPFGVMMSFFVLDI